MQATGKRFKLRLSLSTKALKGKFVDKNRMYKYLILTHTKSMENTNWTDIVTNPPVIISSIIIGIAAALEYFGKNKGNRSVISLVLSVVSSVIVGWGAILKFKNILETNHNIEQKQNPVGQSTVNTNAEQNKALTFTKPEHSENYIPPSAEEPQLPNLSLNLKTVECESYTGGFRLRVKFVMQNLSLANACHVCVNLSMIATLDDTILTIINNKPLESNDYVAIGDSMTIERFYRPPEALSEIKHLYLLIDSYCYDNKFINKQPCKKYLTWDFDKKECYPASEEVINLVDNELSQ